MIEDGKIRESSREEQILNYNNLSLLYDGEYVENGKIITMEKPLNLLKPIWNRDTNLWEEGITDKELADAKKGALILNASEFFPQLIGLQVDENIKYISDEGLKKVGFAYLDKKKPNGLFKCIKETYNRFDGRTNEAIKS